MSITSALQIGVSGLQANSSRVQNISSNIANANTVGYRRTFSEFVTQNTGSTQAGVLTDVRADISANGNIMGTGRSTDLAVQGDGFFVVSRNPNDPVESNYYLTRAGSFTPDQDGNLRNSAGYFLSGFPTDASGATGSVSSTSYNDLSTVNVASYQVQGTPSTRVGVSGNVPAQETGAGTTGTAFESTLRYVNQLGGSDALNLSWTPGATANEWTVNISDEAGNNYGDAMVNFTDSGVNAGSPASYTPGTLPIDPATGVVTLQINNGGTPQPLEIDFGAPGTFEGMTQFSGDYTPPAFSDDGTETGSLERAEMSDSGILYGVFDNGQRRALFQVPLANVANPDQMRSVDGNAYVATRDSGAVSIGNPMLNGLGSINSGALEGSNVDIAEELTDLIQTQRAYSSSAKIITTSDEMLSETLSIKR
ncbi:flagellar hook protein FlgE [Sulfitobacter sp. KE29]|jgi:flagellar hook protein FlgE|uniref:flagellar hook protein FlgE n=2 Tax=Sulfitobacter TaxID=60136 RepID=UPI0007C3EF17|nr:MULTISPECIES: flagellar hook protein FlgE [unclassified Sulfitobacter]KZY53075.1 flagellar hook protein [Sulfitobacter sp. HI0054]MBO9439149.1 flagellar hook protein FlgE [Sulfitobacter sp. R18_2]MDF3419036.1 flagellar hook protein FlgE [Sulfitobacter sp. Ks38]MDF3426518.1 flagellar hook protein FlgE [Sulfitobacter sp. KE29]MDF3430099.1 flagellar hook protein FlgE [Sulfitobacter sp. S46]